MRSSYLRFHTPVTRLTNEQLRYLTEIDYYDHMAWVALDPTIPSQPGMGVARYVRLAEDATVAEAAVTILDRYQGRGLGTALLEILAASAIRNGIRTFRNYVLAENRTMLDIFDQLGGVRIHEGGSVYRVDIALPERPSGIGPESDVRHVLRTVAASSSVRSSSSFQWHAFSPAVTVSR
jgi:GNAT superfamily N-acetyltransferase